MIPQYIQRLSNFGILLWINLFFTAGDDQSTHSNRQNDTELGKQNIDVFRENKWRPIWLSGWIGKAHERNFFYAGLWTSILVCDRN